MPFRVCQPFAPRRTRLLGIVDHEGWRLKRYAIVHGDVPFDEARFRGGRELALSSLPAESLAPDRPGVGTLIEHEGNGIEFAVLAWWDRENELLLRVFVREHDLWRPARGGESICVWDLEVLGKERDAFGATVLASGGRDFAAYLGSSAA